MQATTFTDDELLQKLAIHLALQDDGTAIIKQEILNRIDRRGSLQDIDIQLVDDIIAKLNEIDETDSDLSHQSERSQRLSRQYFEMKECLLQRMITEPSADGVITCGIA